MVYQSGVNHIPLKGGEPLNFGSSSLGIGILSEDTILKVGERTIPTAGDSQINLNSDGTILALETSEIVTLTVGSYTLPFAKGYRIVFLNNFVWKGYLAEDTTVIVGTIEVTFLKNQLMKFFTDEDRTLVISSGKIATDQTFGDVQKQKYNEVFFDRDGNFLK